MRSMRYAYGDTSVEWDATLVQPRRMVEGSHQPIVVDVRGPIILEGAVQILVGGRTVPARWEGDVGQARRCIGVVSPKAGNHRVMVRVGPVMLRAGDVVVSR